MGLPFWNKYWNKFHNRINVFCENGVLLALRGSMSDCTYAANSFLPGAFRYTIVAQFYLKRPFIDST